MLESRLPKVSHLLPQGQSPPIFCSYRACNFNELPGGKGRIGIGAHPIVQDTFALGPVRLWAGTTLKSQNDDVVSRLVDRSAGRLVNWPTGQLLRCSIKTLQINLPSNRIEDTLKMAVDRNTHR